MASWYYYYYHYKDTITRYLAALLVAVAVDVFN